MLITTTSEVPGKKVTEILGLVKGSTIQSRHVGSDFVASLKKVVGGEIKSYSKILAKARTQAIERMEEEAKALGADAIVCLRLTTSEVMNLAAEVLAYGTAVKLGK